MYIIKYIIRIIHPVYFFYIRSIYIRCWKSDHVIRFFNGSGGISCEEKQIILNEHNRLRQLVALGQIHGQPGAANMMEMIWDDELAAIAQRWADHCAESHDSLRNVRRFAVGQNIARSWTTRPPGPYDGESNWRRQISGWFNEVQYYHSGYSKITGHYTQLVEVTIIWELYVYMDNMKNMDIYLVMKNASFEMCLTSSVPSLMNRFWKRRTVI
ncbi:venom allergen 5 isoform X3 [Temnothorax americanus]|uniref:venom allergen 5 isoform X3 n=1 Tax=Temnothorax americanus TaxID=1964332 RepID=UPI004067F6A3